MKLYSVLVVFGALTLAAQAGGRSRQAYPVVEPSPMASLAPLPVVVEPHIVFEPLAYYSTPAQRLKVKSAAVKVNAVLASDCFKNFMLPQPMKWTGGRTNPQVIDHLQGLKGTVPVRFYYARFSSAVAYRMPPSTQINLNTKFFGPWSGDCELAATLAHESAGHSLGEYDHDFDWTREREDTVPYLMGGRKARYGGDAFTACCH